MTSKLRIKVGEIEIDYEGSDDFIKEQFPTLLRTLQELQGLSGPAKPPKPPNAPAGTKTRVPQSMSTNTIAQKLQVKSGSELARAAAARLGIVLSKDTFTRKEISVEMRSAKSFFKRSHANNLDNSLKKLLDDGKLLLQADKTYALADGERTELEKKIAD
jgi:hypothetical protein